MLGVAWCCLGGGVKPTNGKWAQCQRGGERVYDENEQQLFQFLFASGGGDGGWDNTTVKTRRGERGPGEPERPSRSRFRARYPALCRSPRSDRSSPHPYMLVLCRSPRSDIESQRLGSQRSGLMPGLPRCRRRGAKTPRSARLAPPRSGKKRGGGRLFL